MRDEDGKVCTSAEVEHERWKKHLSKIFNIQGKFNVAELRKVRQKPPRLEVEDLRLTMDEL